MIAFAYSLGFFLYCLAMIPVAYWLMQQPSGSSELQEHVWILWCSSEIMLNCSPIELLLLLILVSFLLVVVGVVVAVAAKSMASWCSPIKDLGGSSILNVCVRVGVILPLINYQIDKNCFHASSTKITRRVGFDGTYSGCSQLFVITANCAWITNSVSSSCTPAIFFTILLDDCH